MISARFEDVYSTLGFNALELVLISRLLVIRYLFQYRLLTFRGFRGDHFFMGISES